MLITRTSPFSGQTNQMEINVSDAQIEAWQNGMFAQDAFPHLTPDEREFIMTGITKEEWDATFKEKD